MKKLSKLDKNKKQLHDMTVQDELVAEEPKIKTKSLSRKFTCDCGYAVTLEGFDDKRTKCSACIKK